MRGDLRMHMQRCPTRLISISRTLACMLQRHQGSDMLNRKTGVGGVSFNRAKNCRSLSIDCIKFMKYSLLCTYCESGKATSIGRTCRITVVLHVMYI